MDTLTHALSGALLARATEPKAPRADQLPRRWRMWIGFWAAAFPDSDFITSFIDPLLYLTTHRGITHSVIMLPLWALGLAFLFMLITRRKYSWKAFVGTCALGIAIHIAGDVITAYGTIVLAPLSDWRAQFPTTFIIDPYFSGIIVVGLIASTIWKHTRLPALLGLTALVGLIGFQALQHACAVAVGESFIVTNKLPVAESFAIPQPFSPFHWMVAVVEPRTYHLAHISLVRDVTPPQPPEDAFWLRRVYASYRPVADAHWLSIPRYGTDDPALAESVWQSDAMARYRNFALFPAAIRVDRRPDRSCVWFDDLRFTLVGRTGPFRYGACRDGIDAPWKIYRAPDNVVGKELIDDIMR
jgi:inner membrane protein